jgi:5-carboxymethyl-2-hydroxymuconate isomerase
MPHITIEYSANLKDQIDVPKLVEIVHQAALRTGVFEVAAVRTRAAARDLYVIADGHADNAFVAIGVRVAPGRPAETRRRLGQEIFDAACEFLGKVYATSPLAISLEVQEIDNTAAFRKNNLHSIVKERAI